MLNLPPLEALLAFHGLLTDPIIAALSKAAQSGKAAPSLSAQLVEKCHGQRGPNRGLSVTTIGGQSTSTKHITSC